MSSLLISALNFSPNAGGIARVARLMALVLNKISKENNSPLYSLSLAKPDYDPIGLPEIINYENSRLKFILKNWALNFQASHAIYDFLGTARAHPKLFFKRPYFVFVHGIEVWENARSDRVELARRASMLACNTNYTRQKAFELHGICEDAKICWLATEEDDLPLPKAETSFPPRVLIIARMSNEEHYKGHKELIEAWPKVTAAVPDARLTIVGRGNAMADYQKLAAQHPCRDNIEFLGFVPEEQMEEIWTKTSVFAMPSRGEGFGLVYIEAMRHAIPVIASVHDAGNEVNADNVTGFNVNMDKPDELTERLIYLLKNSDQAKQMGQQAQQRWQEHFRFSAFEARFRPIVDDFLKM